VYFKGKSKKELHQTILKQNTHISNQNNKHHEVMKRLEQLEVLKSKIEQKKEEDDLFYEDGEGNKIPYDKKDIAVIEKLVERKLESRTKKAEAVSKQQREDNAKGNESFWSDLSVYNPELKASVQETVLAEIEKDRSATLDKKGWLRKFVSSQVSTKQAATPSAPVLDKQKKLKATTVTGGGAAPKQVVKKSVSEMDADEYLAFMETQGKKIPRV